MLEIDCIYNYKHESIDSEYRKYMPTNSKGIFKNKYNSLTLIHTLENPYHDIFNDNIINYVLEDIYVNDRRLIDNLWFYNNKEILKRIMDQVDDSEGNTLMFESYKSNKPVHFFKQIDTNLWQYLGIFIIKEIKVEKEYFNYEEYLLAAKAIHLGRNYRYIFRAILCRA